MHPHLIASNPGALPMYRFSSSRCCCCCSRHACSCRGPRLHGLQLHSRNTNLGPFPPRVKLWYRRACKHDLQGPTLLKQQRQQQQRCRGRYLVANRGTRARVGTRCRDLHAAAADWYSCGGLDFQHGLVRKLRCTAGTCAIHPEVGVSCAPTGTTTQPFAHTRRPKGT
jgi:hypothetical protein